MPKWIWSALALFFFLALLTRILTLFSLGSQRHARSFLKPVAPESLPEWDRECLEGADALLNGWGFQRLGWVRQTTRKNGQAVFIHCLIYRHPQKAIFACAAPSLQPIPQYPFSLTFMSFFKHGKICVTRNLDKRLLPKYPSYVTEVEGFWEDHGSQFQAHLQTHDEEASRGEAESMSLSAYCHLMEMADADTCATLQRAGWVEVEAPGDLALTWRGLWVASQNVSRYKAAWLKAVKAWTRKKETYPLPHRVEAEAYLLSQGRSAKPGYMTQIFLIAASFLALSMLGDGDFSWMTGVSLLVILFVHEMGHALAMRWVGFRDVNVFFVPFFGALATGRHAGYVSPWKEALVLLAGPVPGLLAGVLILSGNLGDMLGEGRSFIYDAAWLSVSVNGFNLLPISPLDGGRLMECIAFRHFPKLCTAFLVASGLAMASLAYLSESVVMGFFSLALIFSSLKMGKGNAVQAALLAIRNKYLETTAKAPEAISPRPEPEMLAECFARLRTEPNLSWLDKVTRIKAALAEPLHAVDASIGRRWLTASGLLAVYLLSILLPIALLFRPALSAYVHAPKPLQRGDLPAGQGRLVDALCEDASVIRLIGHKTRDSLYLWAMSLSRQDSIRLGRASQAAQDSLRDEGAVALRIHWPAWSLGELDTTLLTALREGKSYDSLRAIEAGIWESWSQERRMAWIAAKRQQEAEGFLPQANLCAASAH